MPGLQIVKAEVGDAESISAIINALAASFTVRPDGQGAEGFLKSIAPQSICGFIEAPNFQYWKAEIDGKLAGVVAMRDGSHLYHLFVAAGFQGRGLGRALWRHACAAAAAAGNPGFFTVNSTPGAVAVYERFGFRAAGPGVQAMGIAYVPMRLEPYSASAPRV